MAFDVTKLRMGERVVALCAGLLFIAMFIAWYGTAATTLSAWRAFGVLDIYLLLVILVGVALVVLKATQPAPALPVAAATVLTALAGLAVLLILYRIANQPGPNDLVDVKVGAFLGLALALGLTAGGFLTMREEGTSFADARAEAEAMLASRETTTPPGVEPAPAGGRRRPPSSPPPSSPGSSAPADPI
jgi:FtsH-binding integral membrane protein